MTNEPSWDEIFSSQPSSGDADRPAAGTQERTGPVPSDRPTDQPMTRRELREREAAAAAAPKRPAPRSTFATVTGSDGRPPRKKRRRLGWLWALLVVVVVIGAGASAVWFLFEDQVRSVMGWELPDDYDGTGNGQKVNVVVAQGDTGTSIAATLAKDGVTMTSKAFYDVASKAVPAPTFQPGTYALEGQMSAKAALAALLDPKNRVVSTVLIPEGRTLPQIEKLLAAKTGLPENDFVTAAADYTSFGVPSQAPSLEGFLWPGKYSFDPGVSAHDILETLVLRQFQALDEAGVAKADDLKVLTLASIIQKEGGTVADFPKVSRVFTNRLAKGMALQSDATVSYGVGGTSIFTTKAQRADATNKYNTYANLGLPVGPISAPGDAAIDAAVNPAAGPWLYFVLVNGETGETKFSTTLAEHEKGVAEFQQWLKDHPDYKTGG